MIAVRFREEAEADLQSIVEWYQEVAPGALGNILSDIFRAIDRLLRHPRSGMKVPRRTYRRIVSIRYHFKIVDEVDSEAIEILGIYRFQNRKL